MPRNASCSARASLFPLAGDYGSSVAAANSLARSQQLLRSIHSGFPELLPITSLEAKSTADIMKKYERVRPQLADAALGYLAVRDGIDTVFHTRAARFCSISVGTEGVLSPSSAMKAADRRQVPIIGHWSSVGSPRGHKL
jgi:hypothetical protein